MLILYMHKLFILFGIAFFLLLWMYGYIYSKILSFVLLMYMRLNITFMEHGIIVLNLYPVMAVSRSYFMIIDSWYMSCLVMFCRFTTTNLSPYCRYRPTYRVMATHWRMAWQTTLRAAQKIWAQSPCTDVVVSANPLKRSFFPDNFSQNPKMCEIGSNLAEILTSLSRTISEYGFQGKNCTAILKRFAKKNFKIFYGYNPISWKNQVSSFSEWTVMLTKSYAKLALNAICILFAIVSWLLSWVDMPCANIWV